MTARPHDILKTLKRESNNQLCLALSDVPMVVSAGHLKVYLTLLYVLKHVFLHVRSTEVSFLRKWFCQMLKLTLPGERKIVLHIFKANLLFIL